MSKQSFKLIGYGLIAILAIGLFKNVFSQGDNNATKNAIKQGAFLVDVRTPEEFAESSAKSSVNIPLNEVQSRINEFKGKKNIVLFCRSGHRAGNAKLILEENGIKNIVNGGSWQNVQEQIDKK